MHQQGPRTKLHSPLLRKTFGLRNLEDAWRVIRENARTSKSVDVRSEIEKFTEDAGHKLRSLNIRLHRRTFKFPKAKGIPIPKRDERGRATGKFRPIVLAPVESRIVQRALLNTLVEVPRLEHFIHTPYSFGGLRRRKDEVVSGKSTTTGHRDNPAAVPAAIKSVLQEITNGSQFVASADIRSFFTRISKSSAIEIIASAVDDPEFVEFLKLAISVELSNLAELREKAKAFPIEEIGVAQGNSLSPLLGNIVLASFDSEMNAGNCRCIRYIDDFIILGHPWAERQGGERAFEKGDQTTRSHGHGALSRKIFGRCPVNIERL